MPTVSRVLPPERALRLAGCVAILTALYHGIVGHRIIADIGLSGPDLAFVAGTYQLGTMGWLAGGVLLLGAAGMASQQARSLIVGVLSVLYGLPALGTVVLTGGAPSLGGIALAVTVGLALYGRGPVSVGLGSTASG